MPTPETDTAKIVRRLMAEGWELVRHGAGHDVYRHVDKSDRAVVPRHRTLSPGTARSIAKAAGWL